MTNTPTVKALTEVRVGQNFDYATKAEAEAHLSTMFDMDTREGQRQFEELMRNAKIEDRDAESATVKDYYIDAAWESVKRSILWTLKSDATRTNRDLDRLAEEFAAKAEKFVAGLIDKVEEIADEAMRNSAHLDLMEVR